MPTPMPIIAASCGVQSTTSSTRVPTIPMIERLMTIANSAFSSGRPIATTPSVRNSTIAATRMPKISPAPPVSAVDQWMMSPPSATWTPPLPSIVEDVLGHLLDRLRVDVARRILELDLGEGDPAVLGDGRALGERVGDREHLGRLLDLGGDRLDLRPLVEHIAVLDGEHHVRGVARLLRELVPEQVVGALGLRPGQVEVVDELPRRGAPECGESDEGGDPQADYGPAPVMAPRGKFAHK